MKLVKNISGVLAILFSLAALVLFFMPFGEINFNGDVIVRSGTEFAFGSDYENGAEGAQSSQLLFCLILTAFTVLFTILSFAWKKAKNVRWAAIGFSAVDAVYMLVVACRHSNYFLDVRGLIPSNLWNDNTTAYVNSAPLMISIALFLALIASVALLLSADKLAVMASEKPTLTIPKKIIKYLRDYKGEVKKIVWPGPRAVVKNTLIVLAICLIVGLFIWTVDFGLGKLLDLIYQS